jgi:ADP-ribosylglycohydrolase
MTAPPDPTAGNAPDWTHPRPIDASYWLRPGRLLVGEHPGSRSRAQSMERLRSFLEAGVTCFVDLTEPDEMASYEMLLPFETPAGRRVEYLREPITDHGIPADAETMARILAMIDGALEAGHCVYLHCRAGIGRSATAAGCWLAERNPGGGEGALVELADLWQQSARSRHWPTVPETEDQTEYVRKWQRRSMTPATDTRRTRGARRPAQAAGKKGSALDRQQRVRGAWYGLAVGDALGQATTGAEGAALQWAQHTALTLCLADSLAAVQRCDARDQIERYWRWLKEGHRSAAGVPGEAQATADIAKALATWRWRGQPMAGPHDPRDASANSLPRVLAAVLHAGDDIAGGIALGAECSRTTHQSPLIVDACRLYAAMLAGALQGRDDPTVLQGIPEPAAGCYGARSLRADVRSACTSPPGGKATALPEALGVIVLARRIVGKAADFAGAIDEARRVAGEPGSPLPALTGTLYGALHGIDALPAATLDRLAGRAQIDEAARRSFAQPAAAGVRR